MLSMRDFGFFLFLIVMSIKMGLLRGYGMLVLVFGVLHRMDSYIYDMDILLLV